MNLPENLTVDQYLKNGGKQAAYTLASFGIKQGFIKNTFFKFVPSSTYTDTMIEPIEGREQTPLTNDDFAVKEDPVNSSDTKEKIDLLFDAVSRIAEKHQTNILGIKRADGDINHLNALLNKTLLKIMQDKYSFMEKTTSGQEMVKAYAEAVAHMVRKYFDLPSESSKYNIASMGVEKKDLEQRSKTLLNIAHQFIQQIETDIKSQQIKEIRKTVKKTLFEYLKIK
jgi:hypothetical protein